MKAIQITKPRGVEVLEYNEVSISHLRRCGWNSDKRQIMVSPEE
jgi:hypothetical protein